MRYKKRIVKKFTSRSNASRAPSWPARSMVRNDTTTVTPKVFMVNFAASSAGNVVGSWNWQLTSLPDVANYQSMYDQYCIYKIDLLFFPSEAGPPAVAPSNAQFVTAFDYDNATTPGSVSDILNYSNSMVHSLSVMSKRTIRPKVTTALWQSGGANGVGIATEGTWIDLATIVVPHNGLKYGWTQCTTTSVPTMAIYAKYYVLLRKSR